MSLKYWTAGIAIAGGLTACTPAESPSTEPTTAASSDATAPDDAEYAAYMAYVNDPYTTSGASEADLSGLIANLPAYASLTWDEKSLDAATGATVFEGLSIGFGGTEKFGVNFETAKLWGYDDSLLVSRLAGERLTETGALFTRLEGTNVSYFGVVPAINAIFDETLEQLDAELPEGFDFGFDRFDSNTERFVMSGVSLRPWELSLLPAERITDIDDEIPAEVVDIVHAGQRLIAVSRSLSIEKSVSLDTNFTFEMRQPGAETSVSVSVEFAAAENMQGFDIEKNIARGYSGSQTNAYTEATIDGEVIPMSGFPAGFTMAQQESYESAEMRNIKLDKLMGFLARSELPMMDERDLLSLGTWEVSDYVSQLNDKTLLTADRGYFNGENFEWVIPSDLSFGLTGATLNADELSEFFFVFFEAFMSGVDADDLPEDERAQMELVRDGVEKAIELLPEHGLDQIPFDVNLNATWAADTGPADLAFRWDAEGFGRNELDIGITVPVYDALKSAFEAEDREEAFETAFREAFSFKGARWFEDDKGGYDKLFGFANAIGKEYPDEGWGAMLGSMEPAQMRTYLGTMTRMVKASAAAEFPPAEAWIESIAAYLETGGSLEIAANPPVPINEELIDSYEDEPEPEEIVEIFGLTVTHTK
jgi:hypothetical protein